MAHNSPRQDANSQQAANTWGSLANDYEAMFAPFSSAVAAVALEGLDLSSGLQFLDIAAGTGALTLQAAAAGAKVTAIDFSEEMLRALRAKIDDRLEVETLVMDGQELQLPDEAFDGAGSNMGIVLFPDPAKALEEMRRVIREGARAVVTTVANPSETPLMRTIFLALHNTGLEPALGGTPTFQPLSDPDRLSSAFAEAGFRDVTVETATVPWVIEDPKEFWHRWGTVAPPVALLFSLLPKDGLDAAGREFARLVRESHGAGAAVFPTRVLIGRGSR